MEKGKQKSGTVIRKCSCIHEQQDKLHGKDFRVANICNNGDKSRCTVCKDVR